MTLTWANDAAGGTKLNAQNLNLLAEKPLVVSTRVLFQFVAEDGGDDTADGLSWGTAKHEIGPALAAMAQGGVVFVAPGSYRPTATLVLNGHVVVGTQPPHSGTGANANCTILHSFNGDLFRFGDAAVGGGGSLRNLVLLQMGNYTGAALKAVSTTAIRGGAIYCENLYVSSGDGVNGFTRDVDFDGSADATSGGPGLRQVWFTNCQFFGCKTAGATVQLNRVIHATFRSCEIIQAPENAVTQGLSILHAESEDIFWDQLIIGNISTAAAGIGCTFAGVVSGNVTCTSGSANNRFACRITGTKTNAGATSNVTVSTAAIP